jgi:hypothetical protein
MERLEKNREMLARVEHCQANGDECTDWEDEFLESIQNWLMKGSSLTEGQLETLEKIEYKVEFGQAAYWEEFGNDR